MARRSASLALKPVGAIQEFLRFEAAGGILLVIAAAIAVLWANTPGGEIYFSLLQTKVSVLFGDAGLSKSLLHWINDGLMAVFFLLVGLEIKREVVEGELSSPSQAALPGIAAAGGMIMPAACYLALNWGDPAAAGWAIPAATDIAFALGVLALLGARAPTSLKLFLLAVAIIDDLGAIVIIAVFYTADLSLAALALAAAGVVGLVALNRAGVMRFAPFILVGIFLWVCVLKSGVHATLAGVALALAIPLRAKGAAGDGPLHELEHMLHPWVAFGILPLFAFANAGVPLAGFTAGALLDPVTFGIIVGLFLGKQIGVMGATWIAIRAGLGKLPDGASWVQLYGTAVLTGIGFTMSLFIGELAFPAGDQSAVVRVGVLGGSLLSAVVGYLVLFLASPRKAYASPADVLSDAAESAASRRPAPSVRQD